MRRREAREHHVRRHFVGQIYITLNEIARMPLSCCAFGCQSRYKKSTGMKLFRFPTEVKQRNLWIAAVRRKAWVPNASSRLCCLHFVSGKTTYDTTNFIFDT